MSEQQAAGSSSADAKEEESVPADSGAGGTATAVEENAPLFSEAERVQFDADDAQAGGAIGKMLALFFLYTVFAMSIVAWWTFNAIQ